jgi:hypothetical protein
MLPPKDIMNEQFGDKEERLKQIEARQRAQYGEFGPPDFGAEQQEEKQDPPYMDSEQIKQAWSTMPPEEEYHIEVDENEEEDELEIGEYPTPPSLRSPDGAFMQEEEIFPGGPLVSEVNAWKKQFEVDGHTVNLSEFPTGEVFVWRTLNRTEYREVMNLPNTDAVQREEIICEICVLWPYNYNFREMAAQKAGLPAVLSQHIMRESGFAPISPPVRL